MPQHRTPGRQHGHPVIDASAGTLYIVAKTVENGDYKLRLHAPEIKTGQEKFGGPVLIRATVPGSGEGGSTVSFNPITQLQRPGLLLLNGVVYLASGSHCDFDPSHATQYREARDCNRF